MKTGMIRTMAIRVGFGAILAAALAGGVLADAESGLYDPAPPPGSAFVRIINATPSAELASQLDGADWTRTEATGASEYRPVPAGAHQAAIAGKSADFSVEAGQFYSVVVGGDAAAPEVTVLPDAKLDSMAKALVSFYNLTDKPTLSLRTADGKVAVIDDVGADAAGNRQVNPLKVQFAVFEGEQPIAEIDEVSIERGAAYSVIVTDINGQLQAQWARSATRSK